MENSTTLSLSPMRALVLKFQPLARGVPAEVLQPKSTWSNGEAYDATADKLASMFNENFKRYEAGVSPEVNAAAPAPLA